MEAFELDLIVRKKLIQLKGKITSKDIAHADFLRAYKKPKGTLLMCLAESVRYQGCELEQCLLFTLLAVIAETYNLFYCSTSIGYQISIMISVIYALVFCCLVNSKFQLFVQVLFQVVVIILLVLSLNFSFINTYIILGITNSIGLVLISKTIVYLQEYCYFESPSSGFSFQSNLIILIYAVWKAYQVIMVNNYSGLFAAMIALCLINTIKIFILFDYNVLHVINVFCEQSNKNLQEATQNAQQFSQSIALFVQTKDQSTQNQLNQQNEGIPAKQEEIDNPTTLSDVELAQKQHQSGKRIAITIFMLLAFTAQIIYVGISKTNANISTILPFFFNVSCQICFLLMLCESQKILKSYDKDLLTIIFIYLIDATIICLCGIISYFQSSLSLTFETAIFYSIFPLLVVKMFNYINDEVHERLNNGTYYIFFAFSIIPFSLRSIALFQGYTVIVYLIDAVIYVYAIAVLGIWSNRSEMLSIYKEIKSVLAAKKKKIKFFDKLKQLRVNYPNLVQNFLFIHCILLSVLYSLTTFSDTKEQTSYLIFYLAPLLLYFSCLKNTFNFRQSRAQSYSPYKLTVIALLLAIGYVSLGYLSILGGNHDIYSLQVLLNIFLFSVLQQGEKMAVIYMQNYYCFMRVLLVSVFFVFIYLPFISFFIAGYYFTSFSQNYFYYFALGGFFYIWLLITLAGTAIHLVLNLTEKSKKDLFIAQYMENEMKKIGLKENIEKFLMISNEYEMLNHKSQDLLKYLKEERHVMVIIRREKDVPHDYELVEPDDNLAAQRMGIVAKLINPLDIINRIKQAADTEPQSQEIENPVLTYFREKEKARIEISKPVDLNNNLLELKRMAERSKKIEKDIRDIQRSQEFRAMQAAPFEKCGEVLAKFYNFLSQPSECVSRECFLHLLRLLTRQELSTEEADKVYQRFSESTLINEYKFKKFLVDYVQFKYDMRKEKLADILRTFCCYQLVPLSLAKFTQLEYHLRRKKMTLSQESRQIWLKDGGSQEDMKQFREFSVRQARKKERLLNQLALKVEKIDNESSSEHSPSQTSEKSAEKAMNELVRLTMRKQLKDKTFLKPENIYAMMVNALIECYMFYEKQAQNFKIKSIKMSVSNLLALVTKVSDMIFVFGYSTVYLLIAYFQQNFSGSSYAFSSISYPILLTLAAASTLLYIGLIVYHKRDFEMGSLGLDEEHRSLSICSIKFFATQLLFLLGSALANYIISIALNSLICDQTAQVLFNFTSEACYGQKHFVYMFAALMILVVYWPLSAITFPFSTAMDRSLEIKYKSQFEIVYLQFKFLINGYNTLLNPYVFQTEQLIVSVMKVIICFVLAILCGKMQPCSYELMNKIQGKVYILLTILSFAGTLCYFVGMLDSVLITGSVIVLYLVYFIYSTVKNYQKMTEDNPQDDIIQDNIINQQIKIKIIRDYQEEDEAETNSKGEKIVRARRIKTKAALKNDEDQPSDVKLTDLPTQQIKNTSAQVSKHTFKFW